MKTRKIAVIIILAVIFGMVLYQTAFQKVSGFIMSKMMSKPPVVEMGKVIEKDYSDTVESAGRLQAMYSVDIVARAEGYLQKSYFKEGDFVKKGQLLFLVEPDQYLHELQVAKGNVDNTRARLVYAQKQLARAGELVKQDFIAKSAYDNRLSERDALAAQLKLYQASYAEAQRMYGYTHIKAPIDGKIGEILITRGNFVTVKDSVISTLVSTDPIYAMFNLKSEQYLKFRKDPTAKPDLSNMKVQIKLSDGTIYQEDGKVEFVDNQVDPSAGTISLRATFPNKDNLLVPNDYINVIATSTSVKRATLVPQIAVQDSRDGYYVWMLDKDGKTYKRSIKIDEHHGDYWAVQDGLKVGEEIITKGLLKLKEGIKVEIAQPDSEKADESVDKAEQDSKKE